MRRPGRVRRGAKFGGLAVCVLIVLAAFASTTWSLGFNGPDYVLMGVIRAGRLCLFVQRNPIPAEASFEIGHRGGLEFNWQFEFGSDRITSWWVCVPFWMPLLLVAGLTAVLWWRDRIPPGQCQECGYDLTGNVSGVCPECGRKAS